MKTIILIFTLFLSLNISAQKTSIHPDSIVEYRGETHDFLLFEKGVTIVNRNTKREESRRWDLGSNSSDFILFGDQASTKLETGFCTIDITQRRSGHRGLLYSYESFRQINFAQGKISIKQRDNCWYVIYDTSNDNDFSFTATTNETALIDLLYELTEDF